MTHAPSSASPPVDRLGLVAAIASISIVGLAFGHSLPLFSVLLDLYGANDLTIGLNTATAAVAAVLGTPFYPKMMAIIGIKRFLLIGIVVLALAYLGLYVVGDAVAWWYPLRFIFGLSATGLFAASETWINSIAPDRMRGKILGVYGTSLALGFALGPIVLNTVGYDGFAPFGVAMAIVGAAAIPVLFATAPTPSRDNDSHSFFPMLAKAPGTFISAAMFAGVESAVLIFLPIYAIENGWSATVGAQTITAYGLGIVACQILIGMYADRTGPARALLHCAVASAVFAVGFVLAPGSLPVLFVLLFVWGGLVAGLYTIGLTIIGSSFRGNDIAAANTGFVFCYGVGAILGPVLGGAARFFAGPDGLSWVVLGGLVLYAAFLMMRRHSPAP